MLRPVIHLSGMQGIGDTLYARPFIARLAEEYDVYVETVLPELMMGLIGLSSVKFIKPKENTLRTQALQLLTTKAKFVDLPAQHEPINWHYGAKNIGGRTIPGAIESLIGKFEPMGADEYRHRMKLPELPDHYLRLPAKKLAVVRPVTSRTEFLATSRAPIPSYIGWCAKTLRQAGYYVVSIADCDGVNEVMDEEPQADLKLHRGELGILGMLALIAEADIVIGGSGFIVPAAIAANVPLFTLFGGRGAYDAPQRVFDVRMDMSKIGWALPDNFCRCTQLAHECDKTITNLDDKFYSFMSRL